MSHPFENVIKDYLHSVYKKNAEEVLQHSYLLQYCINKTKSANKGSKARSSFANLYAIYVIIEDYLNNGFDKRKRYSSYEGAMFTALLKRQRELPFGEKLQNHALNHRMNEEFLKFFPMTENMPPIMRNRETQRYWINENYLKINVNGKKINIARDIIEIINIYIETKKESFSRFIEQCKKLQNIQNENDTEVKKFIASLLSPNVDARLFEIVSYSILKYYYDGQSIFWGYSLKKITQENLKLYKTGRTNANDGGIDFVMKPLGRFFQVTETLDLKKYFLDIEKIEKYPISFVIKTNDSEKEIRSKLSLDAAKTYVVKNIIDKYLSCIEEIINIPVLTKYFNSVVSKGLIGKVLKEIIIQSKVEFNYFDDEENE
ncbi:hypothetical protein [uncultured Fibrobacter sp.]|uniref:hypothetical protein n=1 Tax=uncultured Fibrobacter sp. TaxID=261512 RepID=UPI002592476D|nr:hypothetical protein [uncultured Fibrobacter sp.]